MKKMNLVFIKAKAKMGISFILLLSFMFLGSVSMSAQSNPKPMDQVFDLIKKEMVAAKKAGALKWEEYRVVDVNPTADAAYLYFRELKNFVASADPLLDVVDSVYAKLKAKYGKSEAIVKGFDAAHQRALDLLFY